MLWCWLDERKGGIQPVKDLEPAISNGSLASPGDLQLSRPINQKTNGKTLKIAVENFSQAGCPSQRPSVKAVKARAAWWNWLLGLTRIEQYHMLCLQLLTNSAIDVMLEMCVESSTLSAFVDMCSQPGIAAECFQKMELLWRVSTSEPNLLEKVSIMLQKLSKIRLRCPYISAE